MSGYCSDCGNQQCICEDDKYEPYGEEWEKELMRWSKKNLVEFIKKLLKEKKRME
jgi:hypothetical protein